MVEPMTQVRGHDRLPKHTGGLAMPATMSGYWRGTVAMRLLIANFPPWRSFRLPRRRRRSQDQCPSGRPAAPTAKSRQITRFSIVRPGSAIDPAIRPADLQSAPLARSCARSIGKQARPIGHAPLRRRGAGDSHAPTIDARRSSIDPQLDHRDRDHLSVADARFLRVGRIEDQRRPRRREHGRERTANHAIIFPTGAPADEAVTPQ